LFNALTSAGAIAENKLFATLDPLTRKLILPGGMEVLLSDTVGFIAKLPTTLVAAFHATLEELESANLLVHVVDITSPRAEERGQVVHEVLREIGVGQVPMLNALNKADLLAPTREALDATRSEARAADSVVVSAAQGWNIDELLRRIEALLERSYKRVRVRIPYDEAALVDLFHRKGAIDSEKHTGLGTLIEGSLPARYADAFTPYAVRGR
jgi:GTP-binding protein HflX